MVSEIKKAMAKQYEPTYRGILDQIVSGPVVHMGSFHIPTGKVMQPPCEVPLRTYQAC
jgi:nitrite reductase/ring-hydroxylating ferredoxin subunit